VEPAPRSLPSLKPPGRREESTWSHPATIGPIVRLLLRRLPGRHSPPLGHAGRVTRYRPFSGGSKRIIAGVGRGCQHGWEMTATSELQRRKGRKWVKSDRAAGVDGHCALM